MSTTKAKPYCRCECGARVELEADGGWGDGFQGVMPNMCEPCWSADQDEQERQEGNAWAYEDSGPYHSDAFCGLNWDGGS